MLVVSIHSYTFMFPNAYDFLVDAHLNRFLVWHPPSWIIDDGIRLVQFTRAVEASSSVPADAQLRQIILPAVDIVGPSENIELLSSYRLLLLVFEKHLLEPFFLGGIFKIFNIPFQVRIPFLGSLSKDKVGKILSILANQKFGMYR